MSAGVVVELSSRSLDLNGSLVPCERCLFPACRSGPILRVPLIVSR
jgi:hypothetical protein